jgi:hypothetical protein
MQVMPATARWTAKKIGLDNFTPNQINDRDTNIAIGTGYLKLVLDDFAGSMPLAAAAYNAGPGRPRSWRNGPILEGGDLGRERAIRGNPRLRQEGAEQHHQLRRYPDRTAAVAQGPAGQHRAASGQHGNRKQGLALSGQESHVMKRILVLGGSGFVGRHVCEKLAQLNCRVTVPTRHYGPRQVGPHAALGGRGRGRRA